VLLRRAALPYSAVVRRGFRMSYESTIPRSVGLSGSSALGEYSIYLNLLLALLVQKHTY
jgi:galactokinase